jgi:hypothetical protein
LIYFFRSEILKIKRTKTKHEFNIRSYFALFYRVRWNPYKHIQISEISVLPDLPNTGLSKMSGTRDSSYYRPKWIEIDQNSKKNFERDITISTNQNSAHYSYKYGGYISNIYKQKYLKYKKNI